MSPLIESLLQSSTTLHGLVLAFGGPINVVLPNQIADNFSAFSGTFTSCGVDGAVVYAHKANQSKALVRELATTNACIDVASLQELQNALSCGFVPARVVCGGPKSPAFLHLAIQVGATISVDSEPELNQLIAIAAQRNAEPTRVLLRISGFAATSQTTSRFGIPVTRVKDVLHQVIDAQDIDFLGFAFHIDSTSANEKIGAIEETMRLVDLAREVGLDPQIIDIGGGYKVNYLNDAQQWANYVAAIKASVLGNGESITWNHAGFGLRNNQGTLAGSFMSYEFYDAQTSQAFLEDMLTTNTPTIKQSAAQLFQENMLQCFIEPGRALLDQCGVTLVRVLEVTTAANGDTLVRVDMNRHDHTSNNSEIFVDPILLARDSETRDTNTDGFFITGNLCMESDFIAAHKIFIEHLPQPGDLFAFVNTAAYFMDFSATTAIQHPSATKVAMWQDTNGNWAWAQDDCYWPHLKQES